MLRRQIIADTLSQKAMAAGATEQAPAKRAYAAGEVRSYTLYFPLHRTPKEGKMDFFYRPEHPRQGCRGGTTPPISPCIAPLMDLAILGAGCEHPRGRWPSGKVAL